MQKTAPLPAVGADRPAAAVGVAASAKRWTSMKKTSRTYHSDRYVSYKTCKWCGLTKELSEFYDGRWGKKCKVCVRARAQKYRREHLEQYAQYAKARANLPHRIEARRKWQEEQKQEIAEYKRRWGAEKGGGGAASKVAY